jgi:hypothetical protein
VIHVQIALGLALAALFPFLAQWASAEVLASAGVLVIVAVGQIGPLCRTAGTIAR